MTIISDVTVEIDTNVANSKIDGVENRAHEIKKAMRAEAISRRDNSWFGWRRFAEDSSTLQPDIDIHSKQQYIQQAAHLRLKLQRFDNVAAMCDKLLFADYITQDQVNSVKKIREEAYERTLYWDKINKWDISEDSEKEFINKLKDIQKKIEQSKSAPRSEAELKAHKELARQVTELME